MKPWSVICKEISDNHEIFATDKCHVWYIFRIHRESSEHKCPLQVDQWYLGKHPPTSPSVPTLCC